ncbi:uncharacterized protein EV154DRAFT_604349 [Mucor mucedo]|uniref:uncharacterized protein n=1 Tax=Mucor mucedo TaxID=29922 RepID=UPI002220827E|nr:uncharacterized protein EV154DRAFT_604349 [Mucor mucedo]KAI7889114.1 hypothetical protein EV154DRAFT_604349 [Mucor mucedo]
MKQDITENILRRLAAYTVENNLTNFDQSTKGTSVICLEDFETHLKQVASTEYGIMKSQYASLFNFLMSKEALESSQKQSYEIMTAGEYKQDLPHLKNSFLDLKTFSTDDAHLLVMYNKNGTMSSERSLTEEIIACYKENQLSKEDVYLVKRGIRERVNAAVQTVFPQFALSVEMIRSCHTELTFPDSTLHLGIIIPKCSSEKKAEFSKFQARHDCLQDMDNYIGCLQEIGMADIQCCPKRGNILLFTDSVSGNLCDISIDRTLLFEREELIKTYLELDERIRPLINVILYFCQGHHLKNADGHPSLSTYSLIMLILNFLMNGLEHPVIPNLQNLSLDNEYISMENRTLWNGQNVDSLGTLLIGFFQYYSNRKNLTGGVSIFRAGGSRRCRKYFHPVVINDPFLPINNIASGCKPDAMEETLKKFDSAWKALTDGRGFQYICGSELQMY